MISYLIKEIDETEIVLPAIQRNFVWNEGKITNMFDSIMRGYPIGIILLQETYLDIKYREFDKDFQKESKLVFKDNHNNKRIKLVLDGQQRLQSLFIALKGTLDNKELYFNVLSGKVANDYKEDFFIFRFLQSSEASELNSKMKENLINTENQLENENINQDKYQLFISVKEIYNSNPESLLKIKNELKKEFLLNDDNALRIETNMHKLNYSIMHDDDILKVSIIDKDAPKDNQYRKSEQDILEVFVRINQQVTILSHSDLIFSMLKLKWKPAAEELPDFIREINNGNNLGIDTDFVIRSLLTVSDLGSRFDVDLLRKSPNVEKVKNNYFKTCNAIKSLVDFMQDECNILNSSIIGGNLNLIPIVYYLANTPDSLVPNSEINKLKKALYIFGFTRPFSRFADSRIGRFVRQELKPLTDATDYSFPLANSISWVHYWQGYNSFDSELLQRNRHLTLHLLQGKLGTKVKYEKNAPEIDHIFPQSILKEKGYDWGIINSYGNFWILSKTKNQNKSNKSPKDYFEDVEDSILEKALIEKDMLNYKQVTTFIKERENKILEKIKKSIGIKDNEMDYSTIWGDKAE